jgi:hypothetical protein
MRFRSIHIEEWKWRISQHQAHDEDDDERGDGERGAARQALPQVGAPAQERRLAYWQAVLNQLDAIGPADLSAHERINYVRVPGANCGPGRSATLARIRNACQCLAICCRYWWTIEVIVSRRLNSFVKSGASRYRSSGPHGYMLAKLHLDCRHYDQQAH